MSPGEKSTAKDAPTAENLKKLDAHPSKQRAASAAPSIKGSQTGGGKRPESLFGGSVQSENYEEMTVDQCDVRIF